MRKDHLIPLTLTLSQPGEGTLNPKLANLMPLLSWEREPEIAG
jgi:hypothetical protein